MEENKKAVIFDIDNTLVDSSKRFEVCQKEARNKKEFWQCFLSEKYMSFDLPNERVIKFLQKYWSEGTKVILVSGRIKETQEKYTYYQLSIFNIPWSEAHFRSKGDFRKDYEYKSEVIQQLIQKYDILFIVDDSPEVRKVAESLSIKAIDPALIS